MQVVILRPSQSGWFWSGVPLTVTPRIIKLLALAVDQKELAPTER